MVSHPVTMTIVAHLMAQTDVNEIGTTLQYLLHRLSITAHAVGLGTVHVVVPQELNLGVSLQ